MTSVQFPDGRRKRAPKSCPLTSVLLQNTCTHKKKYFLSLWYGSTNKELATPTLKILLIPTSHIEVKRKTDHKIPPSCPLTSSCVLCHIRPCSPPHIIYIHNSNNGASRLMEEGSMVRELGVKTGFST